LAVVGTVGGAFPPFGIDPQHGKIQGKERYALMILRQTGMEFEAPALPPNMLLSHVTRTAVVVSRQ